MKANVHIKSGKIITVCGNHAPLQLDSEPSSTQAAPASSFSFPTDTNLASNHSTPTAATDDIHLAKAFKRKPKPKWLTFLTSRLAWIPANWTFAKWKPVLRCALVGWVSLVLFVIPAVEREMGQASILILTVAFLSPPSDPFLMMFEREILIIFFVCVAWAWACLGIFLANLSRKYYNPSVTFIEAATGRYIEAAPSIIMAVFIFFGSAFFLFIRARKGPGPYFVPTVLACICLDISFTTACIYPFPFYDSGRGVVLPVSLHAAACILASLTVFPSTVSNLFTTRLVAVLSPLQEMLEKNIELLAMGPYGDALNDEDTCDSERSSKEGVNHASNVHSSPVSFATLSYTATLEAVRSLKRAGEAALAPLASASRLLHSDLIYSRFAPSDFDAFHELCRQLAGRSDGLGIYFGLVEAGLSTSPDGHLGDVPAMTGGEESAGVRGIGSGGGGMVVGADGGPVAASPRVSVAIDSNHQSVDSLPATLRDDSAPCPADARSLARQRRPYTYGYVPNDAHAQFHLRHSKSAPGLRSDSDLRSPSRALGEGGGAEKNGVTTSNFVPREANSPSLQSRKHPMFRPRTQQSMPLPGLGSVANEDNHSGRAPRIHHSLLPRARTLANGTIHKYDHDRGHRHQHDHVRVSRPFSKKAEWVVGTFESQRYMNLEATRLHDPRAEKWTRLTFGLLKESCTPFLELCALGIDTTKNWLTNDVRSGRLKYFLGIDREEEQVCIKETRKRVEQVREKLKAGLRTFRKEERHLVLNPYLQAFEQSVAPPAAVPPSSLSDVGETAGMTGIYSQTGGDSTNLGHTMFQGERVNIHEGFSSEPDSENDPRHNFDDDTCGKGSHAREGSSTCYTQETSSLRHQDSCEMPPHRYLFNCYVYQYNLMLMGNNIIEMLDEIIRLEAERTEPKLWTPVARLFAWTPWCIADSPDIVEMADDDYDPDIIQGSQKDNIQATELERNTIHKPNDTTAATSRPTLNVPRWYEPESESTDLGLPRHRDPDSLPPRNIFEWTLYKISGFVIGLGGGNSLYALKAGALTVLLCLPNFIKNSAAFAIANRFSWGIFMGQLSLSRFRGDTTFILVARITSTFLGGIAGMLIWYISTGSGNGNPYGLAATCFLMNIVFFVTAVLVVGFSYQDQHVEAPGSPGTGYRVFWKRTLLVSAGVTAAFIASLFPPATTIRRYERRLLATTSAEMGTTYCAILSFANTKRNAEIQDIIVSLIALRTKLARSNALRTNVGYEFSFRGRWPSERYQAVADLQMALTYSLSHLMSVLENLAPSWSRAFLQRTRFIDPDFQGDILAVISMISNALRNGTPLPQITPCPLLDRFTRKYHGLDVIHKDSEEDYGLPRHLSVDTLKNEQYLIFCVGISIAYGIINRLDKLMLAVKEIVGEQYHIHGVGLRPNVGAHLPGMQDHGSERVRFVGGYDEHDHI